MIPVVSDLFSQSITERVLPSKDYALDIEAGRVNGTVEGLEEVKQAIYFILNTERYEYLIYPWEYGVEFSDLIGREHSFVVPEIERRIVDALTQDDRISGVSDFEFERIKNGLHVTFTVATSFGAVKSEVNVNV
jgi:hypothetical protein